MGSLCWKHCNQSQDRIFCVRPIIALRIDTEREISCNSVPRSDPIFHIGSDKNWDMEAGSWNQLHDDCFRNWNPNDRKGSKQNTACSDHTGKKLKSLFLFIEFGNFSIKKYDV